MKASAATPNVLIILIDDMGFGQSGAFGGPINMPTVERLANAGLRCNEVHITALSSPSRAALQSERNHYIVNAGSILEYSTAYRGNNSQRCGIRSEEDHET